MAEVILNYEGDIRTMMCKINDKMEDIISKYLLSIKENENNNLYFLYNGTKINKELTFIEQANELDKNRKKMNIIVTKIIDDIKIKNEIISKDIICPKCKEISLIDINNFKFNFHGCKKNHNINDILLNNYEETQKIDLNQILCDICKKYNKGNTPNNELYICYTCNKNICPLCRSTHDNSHIIINYDDRNYICKEHNDSFIKYCKTCQNNICIICESKHKGHKILDFKNILLDKEDLSKSAKVLNFYIVQFKKKTTIIKDILDRMINKLDMYYKIYNVIINNFNMNKRNYYKLQNLKNLKDFNEIIKEDLDKIINYNFSYNNNPILEINKFGNDYYYINNSNIYVGEMKFNFLTSDKDGKGIMYYKNGNKYEGEWKNDKKEGKGLFYWNNGDRYEGEWKNDNIEGKGIKYYKNGKIEDGNWKNNQFIDN